MPNYKMRCQPRVKGGRFPVSSAFEERLEAAIREEQDRYANSRWGRPSRSFVIANACAFALNVRLSYHYSAPELGKKKR